MRFNKFIIPVFSLTLLATYGNSRTKTIDSSKKPDILTEYQRIFSDSIPQFVSWINDYQGLFTVRQKNILDSIIADFELKTTIEICVVTIDTPWTTKERFDDFILQISKAWGVGKKEKNNGIVIGISSVYRKMRISNGTGIEKYLNDYETKEIVENDFTPFFKQADYYAGTLNGLNSIIAKLNKKMR